LGAGAIIALLAACDHERAPPDSAKELRENHILGMNIGRAISALLADGSIVSWTYTGSPPACDVPIQRPQHPPVVQLTGQCGLRRGGQIFCVGDDSVLTVEPDTFAALGLQAADVVQVAGDCEMCARMTDGTVRSVRPRDGGHGHVGTAIAGVVDAADIASQGRNGCARSARGEVQCWHVEYPYNLSEVEVRATRIPGITDAAMIAFAGGQACARSSDGRVRCWAGVAGEEVALVPSLSRAVDIAGVAVTYDDAQGHGYEHREMCAVEEDGTVLCWSSDAPTGDGPPAPHVIPPHRIKLPSARHLAVGVVGDRAWMLCGWQARGPAHCVARTIGSTTATPHRCETLEATGPFLTH
jgi:hypothetical protein